MSRINVLMIVGNGENSLGGTRAELAGESSPDGIRVSVFDSLDELPPFSEAAATVELAGSVDALRNAAATADAVLLVTRYYAPMPATVHNAIDWLTVCSNGTELHEKPLAVIGYSLDCYRGVWSHRQSGRCGEISESRIIESITVGSLREALAKLAGEVSTVGEATPAQSVGRSRPWMGAPVGRDTNCSPRHHRGADVVP